MGTNRKGKGPVFSILLEITEPTKEGDGYKVVVIATVLYLHKHAPNPPREVVFYVNGLEVKRIETDELGSAPVDISIAPGSYVISASMAEMPGVKASRRISVKAEDKAKKQPAILMVRFFGPNGNQTLHISVFAGDGTPLPEFTGKILDGNKLKSFTTGPDGTYEYAVKIKEESRKIEVLAGADPNLIWRGRLLGP